MFQSPSNLWRPSAPIENLKRRAEILANIRLFFAARNIYEVETPLMYRSSIPDPNIQSIKAICCPAHHQPQTFYLQTSPEFAMKRLLAADSGAIYQICKAFRDEEQGRFHNPEFTILEWYRLGFNHFQLMDEVEELLKIILSCQFAERKTYQQLFLEYLQIDPLAAPISELHDHLAQRQLFDIPNLNYQNRDICLQLLLSHCIEPDLAQNYPLFLYDFPASQAALAKVREGEFPVAERFEVYYKGLELGNGFHELTDAKLQKRRFLQDLQSRKKLQLPQVDIDNLLIEALEHGMPACAGIALGIDRIIMLALNCKSISEVISFNYERI